LEVHAIIPLLLQSICSSNNPLTDRSLESELSLFLGSDNESIGPLILLEFSKIGKLVRLDQNNTDTINLEVIFSLLQRLKIWTMECIEQWKQHPHFGLTYDECLNLTVIFEVNFYCKF
jgi:hypothetical protein